jgi:hypothetical protein
LFIDGSHDFEDVMEDIRDWTPTLSVGSTIAFNDPTIPGVHRALRATVLRSGSSFRNPRLVENSVFFEFHPGTAWRFIDSVSLVRLRITLWLRLRANRFQPHMPRWFVRMGYAVSRMMVGGNSK